jgi:NDP-sugar pyrophosphorylase family protein
MSSSSPSETSSQQHPAAAPATVFLLAAGLGTRLRPLTLHRPKPLLPLGGVPMLDHALALARSHGHTDALVNAHWLWEQVARWAVENGVGLQVESPNILGTGGGLRAAHDQLAERFVVLNADILCDIDLSALLAAVPPGGAAMALRADPVLSARAPVLRDEAGVVVRMREFAGRVDAGIPGTHFTGVHAADRAVLSGVPEGEACILRTAYKAVTDDRLVGSILHAGQWVDIGTPADYLRANLAVLDGTLSTPVDIWARGERAADGSWIGPGAQIEGDVAGSVVGHDAVVPNGTSLRECVVWDGVTVPPGAHHRAIIYDGGVLALDA